MPNSRLKPRKRVARRGVIYGRQSRTKDGSESLDTQVEACLAVAAHHKIDVVDTIVEPPSTSGYKDRGRGRPRWPEVLELVASGAVDCVIAYKTERLSRGGGIGWAPLIDAAEKAGIDLDRFVLIAGTGFMSEFEIGIRATMDREESKKMSQRACDNHERQAATGKPSGGGARPFGYTYSSIDKSLTVNPAEAAMVREAAERVLANGGGLNQICRDWNAQGRPTVYGAAWRPGTLRNILLRASIAGLREHNGQVVAEGTWEPILDRATWEKVKALLVDPARERVPTYRDNLLSGLIKCSMCGQGLATAPVFGKDRYRCQPSPGKPQCGRLAIVKKDVEDLVVEAMLQRIDNPALSRTVAAKTSTTGDIDQAVLALDIEQGEARLVELAEMWAGNEMTRFEYLAARKVIENNVDKARSQLQRDVPRPAILSAAPGVLRSKWENDELSLEEKRAIVRSLIVRVNILPGIRGRNRFDPDRVKPEWRA